MLLLMANVKWDVKEIMSQHNIYVDALLKASTLGASLSKWSLSELFRSLQLPRGSEVIVLSHFQHHDIKASELE